MTDEFFELCLRAERLIKIKDHDKYFKRAKSHFEYCLRAKISWVTQASSEYPKVLLASENPPWGFFYKGSLEGLQHKSLAVVGSRNPSDESRLWVESELREFVEQSHTILVSGGARGIDQMAHAICLRLKKPTVAFLPSGLLKIYPQRFADWVNPIVEAGGAVISQFALDEPMHKGHFHKRNKVIAASSPKLFMVEGQRRSGSMLTANLALNSHANVCTLPQNPLTGAKGNLDLINAGASWVCDAQDLRVFQESQV